MRESTWSKVLLVIVFGSALAIGAALGGGLAGVRNFQTSEELDATQSALPTQLFDIKGRLITEFFSDEKRELVQLSEIPQHLIDAVLVREDRKFFNHGGVHYKRLLSATVGVMTGNFRGGASTLTMQVAGNKFADRRQITYSRKLKEIWYAKLLEMRYSKNEILQFYLNEMPFGGGTNGVEAASKFYFRKSARDISLAEAVLLVNVLSSHTGYSPLKSPDLAMERQRQVLDEMVRLGFANADEADLSFQEYWDNYDFTRYASGGAFSEREDRAPWFSEYVRIQLEDMLLGSQDIYRSGLKVYTTLDLDYQKIADEVMADAIVDVNKRYSEQNKTRVLVGDQTFVPIVDLLSLTFNLDDIRVAGSKKRSQSEKIFHEEIGPVLGLTATLLDIETLRKPAMASAMRREKEAQRNEVEGALVTIDSKTGYVLALVGGSEFSSRNQFNRAVQGGLQPGSSFKPLYYSAAIESGKFTTATMITDRPTVFWNDDGTPYMPLNYKGRWRGRVLLRTALANSMNVPSLKVLDAIGFDAAIDRASRMLDIRDPAEIEANFPRKYPLGLGICSVSPLQMARAFATFPNQGRAVEPVSIRYVQDRDGKIILEPERDAMARAKRTEAQIMSPQTAYVMTDILQSTVNWGTLAYARWKTGGFDRPVAGKTGTTQNWSDAWTIGFTPQMTTAVWFGFDTPGNSLGLELTGATATGPVWAEYMKKIHEGLPVEQFPEPLDGIVRVTVSEKTGMLPAADSDDPTVEEVFIAGTEPRQFSDLARRETAIREEVVENLRNNLFDVSFEIPASSSLFETDDLFDSTQAVGASPDRRNPLLD
jgi:penicillin-binding protein 1A